MFNRFKGFEGFRDALIYWTFLFLLFFIVQNVEGHNQRHKLIPLENEIVRLRNENKYTVRFCFPENTAPESIQGFIFETKTGCLFIESLDFNGLKSVTPAIICRDQPFNTWRGCP